MEENQIPPSQAKITEQIKEYFNTQFDLIRLKGVLKVSNLLAGLIAAIFVLVCSLMLFFFLIITLALYLGEEVFHSYWQGFGCVSLVILVMAVLVAALKNKVIQPPIINILIKNLFK